RYRTVTGVQTCALPISKWTGEKREYLHYISRRNFLRLRLLNFPLHWLLINFLSRIPDFLFEAGRVFFDKRRADEPFSFTNIGLRSEERRVGKECRIWLW